MSESSPQTAAVWVQVVFFSLEIKHPPCGLPANPACNYWGRTTLTPQRYLRLWTESYAVVMPGLWVMTFCITEVHLEQFKSTCTGKRMPGMKLSLYWKWLSANFCPAKEVNIWSFFLYCFCSSSLPQTIRVQRQRLTSEFLTFSVFLGISAAVPSNVVPWVVWHRSSPCVILQRWAGQPLFKKPWCLQRDPPGSQSLMGEIPPLCGYDHSNSNHFPPPSLQCHGNITTSPFLSCSCKSFP